MTRFLTSDGIMEDLEISFQNSESSTNPPNPIKKSYLRIEAPNAPIILYPYFVDASKMTKDSLSGGKVFILS